ncbi:beta-galactosidase GalA [Sphingomonas sp. TDK1]|uniref:beta-galactosidase GalA n=1 Tax=Sphingomonas sp. TDK1 TaxID=453247 RepID=UPI0007D8E7AA|nr:beta-galactosidase GalA [Sphingomonas sp. TDK1]OAN58340.1 beta-galactosidase [Sphingomonas sp. TDK1]
MQRRTILAGAVGGGVAASLPALGATVAVPPSPRERLPLDGEWRFHLGHAADTAKDFNFGLNQQTYAKAGAGTADAAMAAFDDKAWTPVQLPHDWAVELPYAVPPGVKPEEAKDDVAAHGFKAIGRDFPANSVGWYRRLLPIAAGDAGKRIWLEFDGVFRDATVFVNGYVIAHNESGYVPFHADVSDFLNFDGKPNQLTVRADASLGEGWFYEGAGIYRPVWLVKAAPVHVPQWGSFVRSAITPEGAEVTATIEVRNCTEAPVSVLLRQHLVDADGHIVARFPDAPLAPAPDEVLTHEARIALPRPRLWSVETPVLYRLVSTLHADNAVLDRYETSFGIRSIRFDAEQGFFLNDKPVKLLGVCNHQDHAGVGTAIPPALDAWRIARTKEMGANAWRSAHNPPSEAFLDACDRMGLLVIDEARRNSTDPESTSQLDRILRRDRNHPCIILWSVGNEEPQAMDARGGRVSHAMVAHVRRLDPTRPTTQAFDRGHYESAARQVDVIGFNYHTDRTVAFHERFPSQPIIGTETASTVSTRGEYFNDKARQIVRAYDTEYPAWASTAEQWWKVADAHRYVAGGFIWTGFDYRGEPTPHALWPAVSSYFGVMDLCGFPKDNYWYYRAWWRPEPIVHLLPHWNWAGREGQAIEVWAYSNAEAVELLLNGRSLGRRPVVRAGHVEWRVPYAPGRLEARALRGDQVVARCVRETSGPAAAIRLAPDRRLIAADGHDLAILTAEIVDAKGRPVPTAATPLRFTIDGPAALIGVGNGDPTSHESDKAPARSAFNGLAQAIIRHRGAAGVIKFSAEGAGVKGASVAILAR